MEVEVGEGLAVQVDVATTLEGRVWIQLSIPVLRYPLLKSTNQWIPLQYPCMKT